MMSDELVARFVSIFFDKKMCNDTYVVIDDETYIRHMQYLLYVTSYEYILCINKYTGVRSTRLSTVLESPFFKISWDTLSHVSL
jgi:hypothetical protein